MACIRFCRKLPIADTRNNFVLEFLDYYIDPPHYTIDDCLERGLTYSVPLKAKLALLYRPRSRRFDTLFRMFISQDQSLYDPKGTFCYQWCRTCSCFSATPLSGVFFGQSIHANGTKLYSARIIPFKGSWIEFATDINNVMYAHRP